VNIRGDYKIGRSVCPCVRPCACWFVCVYVLWGVISP